jgi:hypothetical protein
MRMQLIVVIGFMGVSLIGCNDSNAAKQVAEAAKQPGERAGEECAPGPKRDNGDTSRPPLEPPGGYPGFTWKKCGGTFGTCTTAEFTAAGNLLTCATPNSTCYPDNMCRAVWQSINKCHPGATMTCMTTAGASGKHTCTNACEWTTCAP